MKLIIAGSRTISVSARSLRSILEELGVPTPEEVVSGGARGVDADGEAYAHMEGIPVTRFFPDWGKGRGAGYIRNAKMVEYVGKDGGLVALWDGVSRGTQQCIKLAEGKGLRVWIYNPNTKGIE